MNRQDFTYSYKEKVLDEYGPIFDRDELPGYSSKLSSIIDIVDETEGIVFIYTRYVNAGIIPLQLALEHNGYKKHRGKASLKFPEWSRSKEQNKTRRTTKREPISFDGRRRSEVSDKFQQAAYMVIDAGTSKSLLQEQLKIINSKENMNGEKIKIILGTVVASEGLDFKRIRSVHILDPWLHLNRIEQTVGRSIRFCSHADLPIEKRNVLIYLHVATLPSDRESIDTSIYRYAEKKSIQIGSVETILKQGAVDRYLYKDVNIINKGTISHVKLNPPMYKTVDIGVDPSDTSYSKVCSYSNVCDFNAQDSDFNNKLGVGEDIVLNDDTLFDQYSSTSIHNLKQKIALLFKEFYVYDIGSISGLLNEYGFNQNTMIYQALHDMVIHKYRIHDKDGNSGYIINSNKYYVYQPFLLEDTTIPLYYRMNLVTLHEKKITLPRLNEVDDTCKCSKTYLPSTIKEVYELMIPQEYEMDVIHMLSTVYDDVSIGHESVVGYLFDRLGFEDKCKLMYGYLHGLVFEFPTYDNLQILLESMMIYKSKSKTEYYFNGETKDKKGTDIFGFVLSYNNQPCYYEYYRGELIPCNKVQLNMLGKSLRRYVRSPHHKIFRTSSPIWGYTIMRHKEYRKECALKFVQPSKGRSETTKYPPGPGNVCIENNPASRLSNLLLLFEEEYPKLFELVNHPDMKNKKNICSLLELTLRYNKHKYAKQSSFYSYDKMWLKYK